MMQRPAAGRTARRTSRRVTRRQFRRTTLAGGMVALAVGGTADAVKVRQQDIDRIEIYTGKKIDELSEDEFNIAMDDLGIKEQELTDQDVRTIEEAQSESYLDELERLAALKEKGVITDEEFEAKKKKILQL
ncbi:SHOCT domain-containing protein [Methanofollis formosanus]|uniref:SHOCT domain-containing protein n=1 Tax=Methanofollis formosanus TaxID=299308 RepID=A0A8G1EGZ0_9EURY|nr:SHOCT domain-containing protein [Methanofollis formosanus]QYZ80295.1 SHOCT domain-containing protein [Methanofollis formosanus]